MQDGTTNTLIQNYSTVVPFVMGLNVWDDNFDFLGRLIFHRYLGAVEFDMSKVDALTKVRYRECLRKEGSSITLLFIVVLLVIVIMGVVVVLVKTNTIKYFFRIYGKEKGVRGEEKVIE